MDASPDLTFELISIAPNVHDECSFSRCIRALSDAIGSTTINQDEFAGTLDAIAKSIRRSDSVTFKYPTLAANKALQEVYRHIYLPGTRERMMVDISPDDFRRIRFEDFYEWFKTQQTALRNGHIEPPASYSPTLQTEEILNPTSRRVDVEEVNIDHHGWGHQSIILIDHAYEREGVDLENATLRALCRPNGSKMELEGEPWHEMGDRLSCHRDILGRDKWLGIFSKKEPPATGAEMTRYAQAIAQLFNSDHRHYLGLRIIVANFLQKQ